jgi:hypothetical protein
MSIPLNSSVQVNFVGRLYGQQTVTTFFYALTPDTATDPADPLALAQAMYDGFGSEFEDHLSSEWSWAAVEVRDPRAAPIWASAELPVAGNGVLGDPSCPPSVAAVITRKTALAGRRYRGRVFIPAVPAANHLEGQLTDAALLDMQDLANNMALPQNVTLPSGTYVMIPQVWSRLLQTGQTIVNCLARRVLRSQRRREIGVGK